MGFSTGRVFFAAPLNTSENDYVREVPQLFSEFPDSGAHKRWWTLMRGTTAVGNETVVC